MEEMDADTVQWLKRRYSDAPPQKKVKFSQIHEELACQFPSTKFNSLTVSKMIRKAFPNAESRPFGRGHQRYFFGLQELEQAHCSSTDDLSKEELRLKLEEERSRRTELELKLKVAEEKVHEMERTMFTSTSLERQLDTITTPCFKIYHGPDSVSHFDDFSIDSMISEVKQHAPDLLQLLSSLGRAPTLMGQPGVKDMETVGALCSLVKGRSEKVLGLQLLMGLMLIARSTNRQVSCTLVKETKLNIKYLCIPVGNQCAESCRYMCVIQHSMEVPQQACDRYEFH